MNHKLCINKLLKTYNHENNNHSLPSICKCGISNRPFFPVADQYKRTNSLRSGRTDAVNMAYLKANLSSLKNYLSDEKAKRKILKYFISPYKKIQKTLPGEK